MADTSLDNYQSQMRKGTLEFIVLLVISRGPVYASDILTELTRSQLIVVEGTLYPLLSRLRKFGLLRYEWQESTSGPPRKYYQLTDSGRQTLDQLKTTWTNLNQSINSLITK